METGEERELARPKLPGEFNYNGWSPDGRSLVCGGMYTQGIYLMDVQTGAVTTVVKAHPKQRHWSPTWSPDGKTIFAIRVRTEKGQWPYSIMAYDMVSGAQRELCPGGYKWSFLVVSPDGRELAFQDREYIKVVPTAGGQARQICPRYRLQAWMPDGRYLLFVKQPWDRPELWRIPVNGGEAEELLEWNERLQIGDDPPYYRWGWGKGFHPDGRQIAYTKQSGEGSHAELWVMENLLRDSRNPFGLAVEVPDPEGDDVKGFAARVKLSGVDGDWNAPQWCDKVHQGKRGSLDGLWEGRLNGDDLSFPAQVKTVGDWVYIYTQYWSGSLLFKSRRQGNRLAGRYIDTDGNSGSGRWVGLIVNDERIDGVWRAASSGGRWDFRRNLATYVAPTSLTSPAGPAGKMTYDHDKDTYTIHGAGSHIFHASDQFHFGHNKLNQDGSITARIDSIENLNNWSMAGLMIKGYGCPGFGVCCGLCHTPKSCGPPVSYRGG